MMARLCIKTEMYIWRNSVQCFKMERMFLLVAYFFHLSTGIIFSGCPPILGAVNTYYRSATGACYYVWPGQAIYKDAKSICKDNGLHLVQLEEMDEQEWLVSKTSAQLWMGLSKSSGTWRWVNSGNKVPLTDSRWGDTGSGQRAYLQTPTKWASASQSASYSIICEMDTTTTSTSEATTITDTSTAPLLASLVTSGTQCSGFRKFYYKPFTVDYLDTLRITSPVKSILECGVKCINDGSCKGVRVVLDQGLCVLLSPSIMYSMCPTDAKCYQVADTL